MEQLLSTLHVRFPQLAFRQGTVFSWSPEANEVIYTTNNLQLTSVWSLLHETGHALLAHTSYASDFQLLRLEVAAWEHAKQLGSELGIVIDENHVQDCLDSYRDWIYARSICPRCGNKSLQQGDLRHYKCFNCRTVWKVTPSRFCRAYRATKNPGAALPAFDALTV